VKQYVAGDLLTADRKFVEPLQFRPTAKLLITTNNRPKVSDESDGFWRRMLVIPFKVQIPEERQDRHLAEKLLRDEAPGIFNWSIEGLRRLQTSERFTASDVASAAVAEYREEDNPVRAFVKEHLEQRPDSTIATDEVWRAYDGYCRLNGERPLPMAAFGKSLKRALPNLEKEYVRRGGRRFYVYRGLELARPTPVTFNFERLLTA
jgi:putative DNA primase/helicase